MNDMMQQPQQEEIQVTLTACRACCAPVRFVCDAASTEVSIFSNYCLMSSSLTVAMSM